MKRNSDKNKYIDVDETLIKRSENNNYDFILDGKMFIINKILVNKIKEWHKDGYYIVIWTSNALGESWARQVCRKLKINKYVNKKLFKPQEIIDDSPLNEWYFKFTNPNDF